MTSLILPYIHIHEENQRYIHKYGYNVILAYNMIRHIYNGKIQACAGIPVYDMYYNTSLNLSSTDICGTLTLFLPSNFTKLE